MDAEKLRDLLPGTELLIRVTKDCNYVSGVGVAVSRLNEGVAFHFVISPDNVEGVAPPKPEPIKVGDIVVSKLGGHLQYKVLGLHDKYVWLEVVRGIDGFYEEDVATHYLKDFKKA